MPHAIRFHQTGGPEVLRWEEVAVGDPAPGEVRLRHRAVGVNFIDTYHRGGLYPLPLPSGLGREGAGVIEAAGERFTRNGEFTTNAEGQLTTPDGYPILGDGGAISVAGGSAEISADGTVLVDNTPVGKLRLVEFDDSNLLERYGQSLFAPVDAAGAPRPGDNTTVVPGGVESSNVQIPFEMAQMTLGLRTYNANQKVINAIDETMGRLINEVGMPT